MTLFTTDELTLYAEWIAQSKRGIKKPTVQILRQIDNLALAYKAVIGIEAAITGFRPIVPTCVTIGKMVLMGRENFKEGERAITTTRFKVGWHLINVLVENDIIKLQKGQNTRDVYLIAAKDKSKKGEERTESEKFLDSLFFLVNANPNEDIPVYCRPVYKEPQPFTEFRHPVAGELVRHANPEVIEYFTEENCPKVYEVINRHMSNAYIVDQDLLEVYWESQEDDIFTLDDKILTKEQREGMEREMQAVLNIATGVGDREFWQYMFYDNRGRLYSSAVYLSHQGSKLSKSLIHLADKKELGEEGWYWLLVHAANCAGEDKLPLNDRYEYANKNLDAWLEIAANPIEDKRWQGKGIDDKFGFLAAILEIKRAVDSEDIFGFKSGLIVAQDATCSGLQVLSAISRDDDAAKMCNIDGSEERGDYYGSIAEELWKDFSYTEEEYEIYERTLPKLYYYMKKVEAYKGKKRKEVIAESKAWQNEHKEEINITSKVFWGRPEIASLKRKLVKRPCMTYFYSCKQRTMSRQLFRDFKTEKEFKGLHPIFCYKLCYKLYSICRKMMPKATEIMEVFIELGLSDFRKGYLHTFQGKAMSDTTIAKKVAEKLRVDRIQTKLIADFAEKGEMEVGFNEDYVEGGLDFSLIAPVTAFKMMQYYRDNITERMKVFYKGRYLTMKVCVEKGKKLSYKKIMNASSPNTVHGMGDAQLVAASILMSIAKSYTVSVIHDSFGCVAADAGQLYKDTRECFYNIFKEDLLANFCEQKNYNHNVEFGKLEIKSVLEDEYFTS